MLPLFTVLPIIRWALARRDPHGDRLRIFVATWVSVYGHTTPLYRFEVKGREHLPETGPYVLVANHESGLDVLVLLMLRTPARFVAEHFFFKYPVVGWLFRLTGQIPLRVGDRESGRRALERAEAALNDGTPVAFFPEGELSPDEMLPFKPGAFVAAKRAGVPIVPVLIEGSGTAWRPGTLVVHGRHVVRITILPPIDPDELRESEPADMAERVRASLLSHRSPIHRAMRAGPTMLAIMFTTTLALGCASNPRPYEIRADHLLERIDDSRFDALLKRHVHEGWVDYPGFCSSSEFGPHTADLARVDLTQASQQERMALYVNAYNAFSIAGILAGGSPSKPWGRYRFFVRDRYRVAGTDTSLLALEREMLVPMGDPRIHFAIVCASTSCPRLRSSVYTAQLIDEELDEAARAFINDPKRNRFNLKTGDAHLSAIFDWYRGEFEEAAGSLESFVAGFVDDASVRERLRHGEFEIEFLDYDWSLNGVPPDPSQRCKGAAAPIR